MNRLQRLRAWSVGALLALAAPWLAAIELTPVLSGLSSPVLVTHAGDGTRRQFVVEQTGKVRVLQPGATTPTTFLDIASLLPPPGGERGLLGLAFHPQYAGNGRFFVFYTRSADGALVISEYKVSADPNVAGTTGKPLLTIPHPTNTNHNGGMLAFGPDGLLYIAVGDGGGSNDPPNNAQNIQSLLGKILRIDVDRADPVAGTPYAVPADNPYVGIAGRDEIFSIGWRNPWRFSFDRISGQAWVGDVGQNALEEVNTPVVKGGNYGWRVYEGNQCTGLDAGLCTPSNFIAPTLQYGHTGGRCSITGGYVYRGSGGALPPGTYVYGDYCTGEIFAWNGSTQTLLLDTALNISAFGEDEQGELYVVGLGGTVSRIAPDAACTFTLTPRRARFPAAGGSGTVSVTTAAGCSWSAASSQPWLTLTGAAAGSGNGTVSYTVAPFSGPPIRRSGSISIGGKSVTVTQTR